LSLAVADMPFSILSVIQLGADGLAVHRHLVDPEPAGINYNSHHDSACGNDYHRDGLPAKVVE
jgi:hypothetical protein